MPLRVASMALGKSRVSADLLKVLDFDQPVQPVTDTLASELETAPVNTVLLYTSLASCLQSALVACEGDVQGVTSKAFRQWQDQATTLIHLAKRYRKQVLMFDEAAVCQYPDKFVKRCADLWGIEVSEQPDLPASQVTEQEALVDLVAAELFRCQPQASRLSGQLMALAQPIGDHEPPQVDVFTVLADYQESRNSALKLESQLAKSQSDNEAADKAKIEVDKALQLAQKQLEQFNLDFSGAKSQINLLLEQLHTTQGSLEKEMQAKAESEKTIESQLQMLEVSQQQTQQLKAELSASHKELNSLMQEFKSTRESLEKQLEAKADSEKTIESQRQALEVSQQQTDQLKAELSASQKELNSLMQEFKLTRESLEKHLQAKAESEKTIESQRQALEVSQQQTDQLKAELSASQKELSSLMQEFKSTRESFEKQLQAKIDSENRLERQRKEVEVLLANADKNTAVLLDQKKLLEDALQALTEEYTQVTQQWSSVDRENARLAQQLLDLEINYAAELQAKAVTEKDKENLTAKLNEASNELETQAKQHQEKLKKLEADLQSAHDAIKAPSNPAVAEKIQQADVSALQLEVALQDLSEENALLMEQLHIVQEELERMCQSPQQQALSTELIQSMLKSLQRVIYPDLNKSQQKQLVDKGFFNGAWYVKAYKDVAGNVSAAQAPLNHFLRHGFFEGRNPCADKNTLAFIQQHPAMLTTQEHPVLYWFLQSAAENNA